MNMWKRTLITVYFTFTLSSGVWASETVLLLSADAPPYNEAAAAFQQELNSPIETVYFSTHSIKIPPDTKMLVTFGGKASKWAQTHPLPQIICLAPGYYSPLAEKNIRIHISSDPDPYQLLKTAQSIQPSLKRLGVLWSGKSTENYVQQLINKQAQSRIKVHDYFCSNPSEIPLALRHIATDIEALWLPTDPQLVTPETFLIFKQFSHENKIPLYVSVPGLVERGATIGVLVGFSSAGKTAASTARSLGNSPNREIYSKELLVVLNEALLKKMGIEVPQEILENSKVISP